MLKKYKDKINNEELYKQEQELIEMKIKSYNYFADCLWALATENRFQDKQNKPTYPRWHEVMLPTENVKPKATGNSIMQDLLTAW